jgi:glutathione S-transferase
MMVTATGGLGDYQVTLPGSFSKKEHAMSDVTVYGIPGSPYVRSVLLGLEEKNVPYTLVRMGPGETKQPPHLERHPFGRIPAFTHGDFQLYETQAILRYIDAVFPGIALRPTEPRAVARMDQMMGIVDWYFFRDIGTTIVFNRVVAPAFGMPTDEAACTAAIPKAKICAQEVDRLIGDRPYVAGDAISLADLMLAPHLEYFSISPEGIAVLQPYPRLTAWLKRIQERPSMQNTSWEKLRQAA